jgi:hypothetical protein
LPANSRSCRPASRSKSEYTIITRRPTLIRCGTSGRARLPFGTSRRSCCRFERTITHAVRPVVGWGKDHVFGRKLILESCRRSSDVNFHLWLWAASSTNVRCRAFRAARTISVSSKSLIRPLQAFLSRGRRIMKAMAAPEGTLGYGTLANGHSEDRT